MSDSATLWTVACQAPPSRRFSSQEYWSALLQGIFPTQELNSCLFCLMYWQVGSLPLVLSGKPGVPMVRGKHKGCTARVLSVPWMRKAKGFWKVPPHFTQQESPASHWSELGQMSGKLKNIIIKVELNQWWVSAQSWTRGDAKPIWGSVSKEGRNKRNHPTNSSYLS